MAYHLITGATGLLGGTLVRDALLAGLDVAILARPNRVATASNRVEDLMQRWEREAGYPLPRPPVLAGDLTEPGLGLDATSLKWMTNHCDSVIHSAASLSFESNEKTGEPRKSNVEGTRHVLEACRATKIRNFHYVSTAYVCGLREGRVLESELDVGQTSGNVYEATKLEAEKMVRSADFLDHLTVFRPAIIIGDSRSGYTTTYHGFYTPLKIAHGVSNRLPVGIPFEVVLRPLGLKGHERKNFVPVDWISRVMTYVISQPDLHGQTYHLAPSNFYTVLEMYKVISESLRSYSSLPEESSDQRFDYEEFSQLMRTQMKTYQSYWRDDPDFDMTNTLAAAPHLPCPRIDKGMLIRTCKYAIENNFGWPLPPLQLAEMDVREQLIHSLGPLTSVTSHDDTERFGLNVVGSGGTQCTVSIGENQRVSIDDGIHRTDGIVRLNSTTYEQLMCDELVIDDALKTGQVLIEGAGLTTDRVKQLFVTIFRTTEPTSVLNEPHFTQNKLVG